jgi:ResB-like family
MATSQVITRHKKRTWQKAISFLGSLKVTVFCLVFASLLVFTGTLYQIEHGIYAAQQKIFRSFFIYWRQIPIFPGGYFIGGLFIFNFACRFLHQFEFIHYKPGIILIHFGLFFLVLGELFNGLISTETVLPLKVHEAKSFSLELKKTELAISLVDAPLKIIFSEKELAQGNVLQDRHLPFTLEIEKILPNAIINVDEISEKPFFVKEMPLSTNDQPNFPAAWIEIRDGSKSFGTILLSSYLEKEESFYYQNKEYKLSIRPKNIDLGFKIKLLEFKQEKHPGTHIPKSFLSRVALYSEVDKFDRDAFITMNHPLRYKGKTIYQSSFNEEEALSFLQIVDNPGKSIPYISSLLVIGGLIIHFFITKKNGG